MPSLEIRSRVYVLTREGEREIQLCLGDITALPVEDAVDVIVVSSLPSLKSKLGLSVAQLAHHHVKEDLRSTCFSWISKPLPHHLPYRQLICCERDHSKTLDYVIIVKELFRSLMPVFNNVSHSVITPLLGSRIQKADPVEMTKTLVESAAKWMRMGLPLQCLKIVVYTDNLSKLSKSAQACVDAFEKLRTTINKRVPVMPVVVALTVDILLIYSAEDSELMKQIQKLLVKRKKDANIKLIDDIHAKPSNWAHAVYAVMMESARVVPILTKGYLRDDACIDAYNVALCANRMTQRHLLAPVCMETCSNMPSYMGLVQWMNCKHHDGEKMAKACDMLMEDITMAKSTKKTDATIYDVFISYSHRNLTMARQVLESLQTSNPDLRVFFDYDELKTGVSWQQTLYTSVDKSCVILALLSEDYLKSPVCTEEFNLALARHLSHVEDVKLIPVCLEPVEAQSFARFVSPIEPDDGDLETAIRNINAAVCKYLETGEKDDAVFRPVEQSQDMDILMSEARKQLFHKHYKFSMDGVHFSQARSVELPEKNSYTVYLSCIASDQKYCQFLQRYLQKIFPADIDFKTSMKSGGTTNIDTSDGAVVFLSRKYMKSVKDIEELHFILNKQRAERKNWLFYPILLEPLPEKPTYIHLIHCLTCLSDTFWDELTETGDRSKAFPSDVLTLVGDIGKNHGPLMDDEIIPLMKACCDLAALIGNESDVPRLTPDDGTLVNIIELQEAAKASDEEDIISRDELIDDEMSGNEFKHEGKVEEEEPNIGITDKKTLANTEASSSTTSRLAGNTQCTENSTSSDTELKHEEPAKSFPVGNGQMTDDAGLPVQKEQAKTSPADDRHTANKKGLPPEEKPVGRSSACTLL